MFALDETVASHAPGAAANGTPDAVPAMRQRTLAHAARHDILCRMAPALRHDMVVNLQSLGMLAEALSARLERGATENEELQAVVSKLNRLSRRAVETCLGVATWMEPAEDDAVTLHEGVAETVRLLRSSMNFRGFELVHDAPVASFEVGRTALRFLLPAALFCLVDAAQGPGELSIRTEASATHAVVQVGFRPDAEGTLLHEPSELPLSWAEVQALAASESVELRRHGNQVVLRFPRAVATSPLKMVPV
jgi:hypothetical protein